MGLFRWTQGLVVFGAGFAAVNVAAFWGGVGLWHSSHPVSLAASSLLAKKNRLVSAGGNSTCSAISGSVVCWGGSSRIREVPDSLLRASSVMVGENFACALEAAGRLSCWGDVPGGEGLPSGRVLSADAHGRSLCWVTETQGVSCLGPLVPPKTSTATFDVAVSDGLVCLLDKGGRVTCQAEGGSPTGIEGQFSRLFAGPHSICGVSGAGRVRCLGGSSHAVLAEMQGVLDVALGQGHTCVASGEWVPSCWGDGSRGQTAIPEGLGRVELLVAGDNHTCALLPRGVVRCWGDNSQGQLLIPGE